MPPNFWEAGHGLICVGSALFIASDVYSGNALATPVNVDVDLRVLKMIPWKGGHLDVVAESFNLLNHRNVFLLNTTFG